MKRLVIVSLLLAVPFLFAQSAPPRTGASHAEYRWHNGVALPDSTVTPGAVRTTDVKEICDPKFRTKPFRKTTQSMKAQVYEEYGVERNKGICSGGCEVDHLVPLEIGGLDDIKNLWPQPSQPSPGFHQKDKLENELRKEVCGGKISLTMAQKELMSDWWVAYSKRWPAR